MSIKTKLLAPLAAMIFASSAHSGLIIDSIDMYVADISYQVNRSSTFVDALANFGAAYDSNPICEVSLDSLEGVGAKYNCGGKARSNTGTLFLISGYNTGASQIQFGTDWGRGGYSSISAEGSSDIKKYTDDIWWGRNWNNRDVLSFNFSAQGAFSMILLGFEACCNGSTSARTREFGVDGLAQDAAWQSLAVNAAAVPVPPAAWLFGLGLVGLVMSRIRRREYAGVPLAVRS